MAYGHVCRFRLTGRHIAEGGSLHEQLCENLKYRRDNDIFGTLAATHKYKQAGTVTDPIQPCA